MAQLNSPHPGEILKNKFLRRIGVSQNQLAQAIGVPGNRMGTGQGFEREGKVPVPDAVLLAEVQHPAGMVQRGFGPPEQRVDAGDLPFAAG